MRCPAARAPSHLRQIVLSVSLGVILTALALIATYLTIDRHVQV